MELRFILVFLFFGRRTFSMSVLSPFQSKPSPSSHSIATFSFKDNMTSLKMAGFGSVASSKKKKRKKETSNFDVNASLSRLEKKYDELMLASTKREIEDENEEFATTEYVVTARVTKQGCGVDDWIPVSQLCVVSPIGEYRRDEIESHESNGGDRLDLARAATSSFCREFSHVAALASSVFSKVSRNQIQYAIEPLDSFHKYVYDIVMEEKNNGFMSKAKAKEILGINDTTSSTLTSADIKRAYRDLSFQVHPDRLESDSNISQDEATNNFRSVRMAYEVLMSGIRDNGMSWYESLGGRERTGFRPINLLPLDTAREIMSTRQTKGAVCCMDRDLVQSFAARNLNQAKQ